MSDLNSNENSNPKVDINKNLQTQTKEELRQLLIDLTELRIEDKGSDNYLDKINERHELLSGATISIKEVQDVIANSLQLYSVKFTQDYWLEMYRINAWTTLNPKTYIKPTIVGKYINETIYARFDKEVLPTLQQLNPFISRGFRMHKLFQWLNEEGQKQLEIYISDAIRIMKTCETQYEFRIKLYEEFGIPYQITLFGKTEII